MRKGMVRSQEMEKRRRRRRRRRGGGGGGGGGEQKKEKEGRKKKVRIKIPAFVHETFSACALHVSDNSLQLV